MSLRYKYIITSGDLSLPPHGCCQKLPIMLTMTLTFQLHHTHMDGTGTLYQGLWPLNSTARTWVQAPEATQSSLPRSIMTFQLPRATSSYIPLQWLWHFQLVPPAIKHFQFYHQLLHIRTTHTFGKSRLKTSSFLQAVHISTTDKSSYRSHFNVVNSTTGCYKQRLTVIFPLT